MHTVVMGERDLWQEYAEEIRVVLLYIALAHRQAIHGLILQPMVRALREFPLIRWVVVQTSPYKPTIYIFSIF